VKLRQTPGKPTEVVEKLAAAEGEHIQRRRWLPVDFGRKVKQVPEILRHNLRRDIFVALGRIRIWL
jgi:hypothetical protein